MGDELLIEHDNHIWTISINRPERRNAINQSVLKAISGFFVEIVPREKPRVVVLRGAGDKSFCSGADLSVMTTVDARGLVIQALSDIYCCPYPTIAMIYGYAVGAGCDIASACDFRVADENARIGINPVKLGLVYFPDSIKRFIDQVGLSNTRKMLLTGRFFPAAEARDMGLVQYVVPKGSVHDTTYALAAELAENAPLSMTGNKLIMNTVLKNRFDAADLEAIDRASKAAASSRDLVEGVTALLEKRKPDFRGE